MLVARVTLLVHGLAAAAWFSLMPGGFAWGDARFWLNEALPVLAVAAVVLGLVALHRRGVGTGRTILAAVASVWLGVALCARVVFPVSGGWLAVLIAVVAAAVLVATRTARVVLVSLCIAGGAVGPWLERADDASTRPLDIAAPEGALPGSAVQVSCGALTLRLDPMLKFQSTSPDRGWSLFSRAADSPAGVLAISRDGGETGLEAFTTLDHDVYSHLNHFTRIDISGRHDLRVGFSATPGFITRVEPSDYPVGRPLRFAYLGAEGSLHVVEASSAEKGPFRELASGEMDGGTLELTLYDGEQAQCSIALDTFAAQAGLVLSPTAGWGVPVNAIELLRDGDEAAIIVSLAGTSIGRGWDTVGHRAGAYVNRLRVRRR